MVFISTEARGLAKVQSVFTTADNYILAVRNPAFDVGIIGFTVITPFFRIINYNMRLESHLASQTQTEFYALIPEQTSARKTAGHSNAGQTEHNAWAHL